MGQSETMKFKSIAFFLLFFSVHECVADPCNFKGLTVGESYDPKQVMQILGIKKYKIDPMVSSMMVTKDEERKFGHLGANEHSLWRVGPYCLGTTCEIPYGVEIQPNIASSLEIIYGPNNLVTDIRILFSEKYWGPVQASLLQEYGPGWSTQEEPKFEMRDEVSGNSLSVHRIMYYRIADAQSMKLNKKCELALTNYASIFLHNGPLGVYQSSFIISLRNGQ
jgi:hypothetical protein